ncbi:MAG: hypothetical protein HUK25_06480 [Treponema sp.]|nr:hypothetical protein [Treponema sp.]
MGLQPIDLQVMYSQSPNVSKLAGGNVQASQLSDSMQQTVIAQQNLENARKVHETNNDQSQSSEINADARGQGGAFEGKQSEENGSAERKEQPFQNVYKEKYLGTIIDITR